jgi:hypothetical protein
MKKHLLVLGIIFLFLSSVVPVTTGVNVRTSILRNNDNTWWRTFGGPSDDFGYSLEQTNDNGYIIAGDTGISGKYDVDGWLIKTDAVGNQEWNKTYSELPIWGFESIHSVKQTIDGGYILAGCRESEDYITLCWLVKIDDGGNQIWNKTYYFGRNSFANSVLQTSDEGYFIVGILFYNDTSENSNILLLRVDEDGNELWNRTYGNDMENMGMACKQTIDGGYIVAGVYYVESFDNSFPWLLKLDANGDEEWIKTFSSNDDYYWEVFDVLQTDDGGYALVGALDDKSFWWYYGWMIKTDMEGNETWRRKYNNYIWYNTPYSFCQTSDGGYILTGMTANKFDGNIDLWLGKTDEYGKIKWSRRYGKKNSETIYIMEGGSGVIQVDDGGYTVLGNSFITGPDRYDSDICLFKTDKDGNVKTKAVTGNMLLLRIFERFPLLQKLIQPQLRFGH